MMRQAGRYMQVYRELAKKHPSFRERSEVPDLIVETTLQPWRAFQPDGVILFSDILTPLPAMGVEFEIDDAKGPLIGNPIRTAEGLSILRPLDTDYVDFVRESLGIIRGEVEAGAGPEGPAAVLGFVGCPWTLATYIVEGKSSIYYQTIKTMAASGSDVLRQLLGHLASEITTYVRLQIDAGAQAIQLFDSWGGQLPPRVWDAWSRPYIQQIISGVRETHPSTPLTLYINGSSGLLERIKATGVDVVGVDWQVDMADARQRLGADVALQGNIDPCTLLATQDAITAEVRQCLASAGKQGHILNLGHGVLVNTPEENVKHFFQLAKDIKYADL